MEIIDIPRACGKTMMLIWKSETSGIPILAANKSSCRYIKDKAYEGGFEIPEPISAYDIGDREYRGKVLPEKVLIDELPEVIKVLTGFTVDTATMTSGSRELFLRKELEKGM